MPENSSARPLTVLVVDDHPDTAATFADLLSLHGHRVVTAGRADTAVAAAQADPPDVVFLDIGLPGGNGYVAARRLCAALGRRPLLIAMTGFPGLEESSRREGFDHHFLKPAEPAAVAELLADYARRLTN